MKVYGIARPRRLQIDECRTCRRDSSSQTGGKLLYYQTCPDFPKPRTTMQTRSALLAFSLAVTGPAFALSASTESDATHASSYLKTLPNIPPPVIDAAQIVTLAALPLSCIDHPQDAPDHPHDYLWVHDSKRRTVDDYDKTRAFYGCFDWHSAVNSTWTLIYVLKQNPKMALAPSSVSASPNTSPPPTSPAKSPSSPTPRTPK